MRTEPPISSIDSTPPPAKAGTGRIVLATVLAAVFASVANGLVALAGVAAGADPATTGLTPPAYITFTVLGVLVGAIGWRLVGRARAAKRILLVLVPLVLVLSLIPDLLLWLTAGEPAARTAAVTLGVMHVATAAVAIPIYLRVLPLRREPLTGSSPAVATD